MKICNKKYLMLSSAILAGVLFVCGNNVKADTTTPATTSVQQQTEAIPDKSLITPVASNGNETLSEVAKDNNVSLVVLEKLNDNYAPNKVIANGTPLYLPQNVNYSNIFLELISARSGLSSAQYKTYYGKLSSRERAAKIWIATHESGLNYNARNGRYIGRFQLDRAYLHGNYSHVNQERTADRYVKGRYGSWVAAKRFWLTHHWY